MRIILSAAVALAALAAVAGLTRGDNDADPHAQKKAAQKAILALSERLDAPDVKERAEKIVRECDSEHISSVFMRTSRGGLGVGPLVPAPGNDSGERLIMLWRNKPPTADDLAKHQKDMGRVSRVIRAMSELAPHRVPNNARKAAAQEWAAVAKEFHGAALGLDRAVEASDPKAIRTAAQKLHNTCCHCHSLLE